MELRDDHTLRTVDDEGAGVGHERNLAHVDLLLLDILDRTPGVLGAAPAAGCLLLVEHQPQRYPERRCKGLASKPALAHVERRLLAAIAHVLERRIPE